MGGKKNILKGFDESMLDFIYSSTENANTFLEENGFNTQAELNSGLTKLKNATFIAHAKINQDNDDLLLNSALDKLKKAIADNINKTGDILKNLLREKAPAFHYRKLESWTDDEIREVLNDLDLVQLVEELEKTQYE